MIKERLYIGEAVIATVVGIAIGECLAVISSNKNSWISRNDDADFCSVTSGPYALNLFSPGQWGGIENIEITNEITLEVTRVVIAIGVFAVG